MPESVPWLIANHKLEKAEYIVRHVFKAPYARLPTSFTVRRQVSLPSNVQPLSGCVEQLLMLAVASVCMGNVI